MQRITILTTILALTLAWSMAAKAQETLIFQNNPVVKISPPRPFFIVGDPVVLCFTYQNKSGQKSLLDLPGGLPRGMLTRVLGPDGALLSPNLRDRGSLAGQGPPAGIHDWDLFTLQYGEPVEICVDIASLYEFRQPGQHTVKFLYGDSEIAETQVNLIALSETQTLQLDGLCFFPATLRARFLGYALPAQCAASIGKSTFENKERWFLSLKNVKIGAGEFANYINSIEVPDNTTLEKAEIDFKWQVWTLLQSQGKSSLVIFDLFTRKTHTAIPWTTETIEMGSSLTGGDSTLPHKPKTVIAGIAGQPKITTLSWGFEPQFKH